MSRIQNTRGPTGDHDPLLTVDERNIYIIQGINVVKGLKIILYYEK